MILLLLAAAAPACATCHAAEAKAHAPTSMAHALTRAADTNLPNLSFSSAGSTWSLRRESKSLSYSVTDGTSTLETPLTWIFGAGSMGRTFLYERSGSWFESTLSYYSATRALDFTPGHLDRPRRNLEESLGRKIDPAEARRCFGCHATGGTVPTALGVQCSHCHAGADRHAATLSKMPSLSKLPTEDVSSLCGTCHRTWEDITTNGPRGVVNVRFQPYRLASSVCYDATDRRIACTSCHDPHSDVRKDIGYYDAKCLACHTASQPCPTATKNCVECHMPATTIPGIHFTFRDHWIRVVKPGERYPDLGAAR
ncbi:MAG TPA: hypothetical protein VNH18_07850 [Bryobacteraceae bacterium]|nr:hypothetical protein [Bryobacteraceae bacterium]